MARHEKGSYDLSEAEQRDIVTLIQQGKALPEKGNAPCSVELYEASLP
jgi:hypothetical protein